MLPCMPGMNRRRCGKRNWVERAERLLGLVSPVRIEGYDISHLAGEDT